MASGLFQPLFVEGIDEVAEGAWFRFAPAVVALWPVTDPDYPYGLTLARRALARQYPLVVRLGGTGRIADIIRVDNGFVRSIYTKDDDSLTVDVAAISGRGGRPLGLLVRLVE